MKINLQSWGIIVSAVASFSIGIGFYYLGTKKSDLALKKPAIIITRAHPLPEKFSREVGTLELRSGPADYFPIVGQLSKKDDYQIIDSNGDWYRVAPIRNPASAAWTKLNPSLR